MRAATAEHELEKRGKHAIVKEAQRQQLKSRKTGREVLQYTSSQALTKFADKELAQELAECAPEIASEFTMQQALKYKDPSKSDSLCSVTPLFILSLLELPIFL